MKLENFERAKLILAERGTYIKSENRCANLISNFEKVSYTLQFPQSTDIAGVVCPLHVSRHIVKKMLEEYHKELETEIERLTKEFEDL